MALFHAHFSSEVLHVQVSVEVILPEPKKRIGWETEGGEPALPKVLYLLHGYSDDQTSWLRNTSIERYAAEHGVAVIMPAVNHSFYTNEVSGERYWDFVAEELPWLIHRVFRLSDKPEDTFVAGLSMGGYGAMKLALTHPERFAAAASFSGAADIATMRTRNPANFVRIFGKKSVKGTEHDLFHLMKANADVPRKPKLYVSCGTADFLYGQHQKFVPALRKCGWNVTSHDEPDAVHEWGFWDREISKFIPWMLED